MTDLVQTFELYLERKINETITAYLENNDIASNDMSESRIREIAQAEAEDVIKNADYDISVST